VAARDSLSDAFRLRFFSRLFFGIYVSIGKPCGAFRFFVAARRGFFLVMPLPPHPFRLFRHRPDLAGSPDAGLFRFPFTLLFSCFFIPFAGPSETTVRTRNSYMGCNSNLHWE